MTLQNFALKAIGSCINLFALFDPQRAGFLSIRLFCMPLSKKMRPYEAAFLNQAKFKTIQYDGKLIQTYRWGEGSKVILLVHGWASHSFRWKNYIETLVQKEYTVYAFDAPGHGMSQGRMITLPLYSSIIDHVSQQISGLDAIIGHSFGGYAIIHWLNTKLNDKEIKAVILAAPGEVSDFMNMYQKQLGLSNRAIRATEQEFRRMTNKTPADFSAPLLAQNLNYPCLIIHDKDDKDTSYQYSERLNQSWKGSQFILTSGLGHKLKSKDVLEYVIQFLK